MKPPGSARAIGAGRAVLELPKTVCLKGGGPRMHRYFKKFYCNM